MSKRCDSAACERLCQAFCYVCKKNLCRKHFDEHDHSLNNLLKLFNEKIRELDDRLDDLNSEERIENCYDKLDQWKSQAIQSIERFYEKKSEEIQRHFQENIRKHEEKLNCLQNEIQQYLIEENLEKDQIKQFQIDLEQFENDVQQLEQTIFHIDIQPLNIDKNLFSFQQINTNRFVLNQLSAPYRTIHCSNRSAKPLTSNDNHLLIYRNQSLCLIDRQFTIIKQIPWTFGRIWDMSWSSTLNQFLLLGHFEIFRTDENLSTIERIQTIPRANYWSCTCSPTCLYLSSNDEHSSTINEFRLQSSIEFNRKVFNSSKDHFIKDISYRNQTILLTNFDKIELRTIEKFELIWSLDLDIPGGDCLNTLRCSPINDNQWLIADFLNQRLFQITQQGKLKKIFFYNESPWYIHLFHPNMLLISTKTSIHFHRL